MNLLFVKNTLFWKFYNKHVQIVQIHFFFVPADNFDAFYMNVH